jgi:hypothetical protein
MQFEHYSYHYIADNLDHELYKPPYLQKINTKCAIL